MCKCGQKDQHVTYTIHALKIVLWSLAVSMVYRPHAFEECIFEAWNLPKVYFGGVTRLPKGLFPLVSALLFLCSPHLCHLNRSFCVVIALYLLCLFSRTVWELENRECKQKTNLSGEGKCEFSNVSIFTFINLSETYLIGSYASMSLFRGQKSPFLRATHGCRSRVQELIFPTRAQLKGECVNC